MTDRIDKDALIEKMARAIASSVINAPEIVDLHLPVSENLLDRCREDATVMLDTILPDIEKLLPPERSVVLVPTNPKELAATRQAAFSTGNSFDESLYVEWKP